MVIDSTSLEQRDALARRELGSFLRSRRERLRPSDVGLPATGRRRTPGLRREEVAVLAGIGVTWYAWLEQGRAVGASHQVLAAIADALRLDPDEREHLWRLSEIPTSDAPDDQTEQVVTEAHLRLLAALGPIPACIQTAKFDILACNAPYRFLCGDLDAAPLEDRNCMVKLFLDPAWKHFHEDHEAVRTRMVARFRSAMPEHLDDPAWIGLADRLRASSAAFARMWERHDLSSTGHTEQTVRLRDDGPVRVMLTRLRLETAPTVRLTAFQPVGEDDARRLATHAARHADAPAVTAR
ncbi:helix-turn-helix transcriptional regulator [Microbacterium sp.]|uniref:helix-turn-helix transcriptional regulator n=1 Tax=Microbacterium sp. TaxID=51671 RepID=UPI003341E9DD